jgi:hypothetical protein
MSILDMWLRMTLPGYAPEVTRDQLGNLPAGPWADPFRPPPFDPVADIQQGGTGKPITRPDRGGK